MAIIDFPILYFPDPTKNRPLGAGQIFVGEPAQDPETNPKQLNIVQGDGTVTPVPQPFILSYGGVPVYNGSPVRLDVDGNYSIRVRDKNGAEVYYIQDAYEGQPVTVEDLPEILMPYVSAEFGTVQDMIDGEALNNTEVIDFSMYVGRQVSTTYYSDSSKTGGALYIIKTSSQVVSDGDDIDGDKNHYVGGGTAYAAVINPSQSIYPSQAGSQSSVKRFNFDNIADLKAQPSSIFSVGDRVNISNYYSGWETSTDDPYPFSGTIVDDDTVIAIRGAAADNYGDHSLGPDINFLADIDDGFINKVWGCRPQNDVDDSDQLAAFFSAPRAGQDAKFKFVGGNQYIKAVSQLEIVGLGLVVITGEDSTLLLDGGIATIYGLRIRDCERVKWDGLNCDLNSSTYTGAVRIQDIRYQVKIQNCDFYNFNTEDSAGFECAQQSGFDIDSINKNPANISNNSSPGLQVVNCGFFNEADVLDTSFDYDDNYCGGTGIRLNNDSEYWRVTNCGFFGLCIGMWIESGNGSIVNCEFQEILGVAQKSFIASAIPEGGGVYLPSSGDNNGKLNITGCKFNHNWGFSVRSAYSSNNRPVCIDNNQFIANSFTAVNITGTKRSRITNNYFERAYNYLSIPSWPWAGFNSDRICFIQLASNSDNCTISGNDGNDLPNGYLVENLSTAPGYVSKITDNTISSTVTGAPSPFYSATPTIVRDNDVMG